MAIYENVYIGSFIYQLGIAVGKKGNENNSSVNLFQQTPADKTLSDLLTSVDGRFIILEFKREKNKNDSKEKSKAKKLSDEISDTKLVDISNKCHFIGIGKENSEEACIEFHKYLCFFDDNEYINVKTSPSLCLIDNFIDKYINNKLIFENSKYNSIELQEFLNERNTSIGVASEDFMKYLRFLHEISNEEGVQGSSGGIILCMDKSGNLGMLPTDNIYTLVMNLDQKLDQSQATFQHYDAPEHRVHRRR